MNRRWLTFWLVVSLVIWFFIFKVGASLVHADGWSTADAALFGTFTGLQYLDYKQTLDIAEDGRELNPILGKSPTDVEVSAYFLVATVGTWLLADNLEPQWRTALLVFACLAQAYTVDRNWRLGWTVDL